MSAFLIKSRADRYGANAIPWMMGMALAEHTRRPLFHECSPSCARYLGSVMHDSLVKFCSSGSAPDDAELIDVEQRWEEACERLAAASAQSPVDAFRKTAIYEHLREQFSLRFGKACMTACCVHVRLDDLRHQSPDGYQEFIGEARLVQLLTWLHSHEEYGGRGLRIETNPADATFCESIVAHLPFHVCVDSHEDVEAAVWSMAQSDPFVMSRSTFAIAAGLLSPTRCYTYEAWVHYNQVLGFRASEHMQVLGFPS